MSELKGGDYADLWTLWSLWFYIFFNSQIYFHFQCVPNIDNWYCHSMWGLGKLLSGDGTQPPVLRSSSEGANLWAATYKKALEHICLFHKFILIILGLQAYIILGFSLQHFLMLHKPSHSLLQHARLGIHYSTDTKYQLEGIADVPSGLGKVGVAFNYVT